jgi:protein involved in polysaccharide export with SLBB domain
VDIPKFYATGVDEYNPFLLDGDIIFVPMKNPARNSIGVYGAVNAPGRYEFAEGDSLLALLEIAQGVTLAADMAHVKIQRVNDQGVQSEDIEINLLQPVDGRRRNAGLQRGDRIVVPTKEEHREIHTVTVAGEIARPGVYPIARAGTRISKVLSDVGGFTPRALLSGATLLRRDEDSKEVFGAQLNYLRNLRSQQLTSADSGYFSIDLRVGRHPVVLDFVKLLVEKDSTQDLALMDDDFIYIPTNTQTVLVHGQVQNPGYLPFIPGKEYSYYIEKAGGYSELAVSGDTRVVKKGTLEWIDPDDTTIQPGDQVWVPKKPIRDFSQTFPILRDIIAVTASLATAVILGFQVFR